MEFGKRNLLAPSIHLVVSTGRRFPALLSRPTSRAGLEVLNLGSKQEFSLTERNSLEFAALDQIADGLNAHAAYLGCFYLSDEVFEVYFQAVTISLIKFKDFCIIVAARLKHVERAALLSQGSSQSRGGPTPAKDKPARLCKLLRNRGKYARCKLGCQSTETV